MVLRSAIKSERRSFQSLGWGDVNRSRRRPSRRETSSNNSKNRYSPPASYEFTFWPSSQISFAPWSIRLRASRKMLSLSRDTSRPRVNGTMQNEQRLLQPLVMAT